MKRKNTFYRTLLILPLMCLPYFMQSQNYFQTVYSTTYDKTSREILRTSDGGYLIAGITNTSIYSDAAVYVMKTDAAGNKLWDKSYGGSKIDYCYSMVETTDGNYMLVGFSQSFGGGDYDIYLLKIDPAGVSLFENKLGGGFGYDESREIIKTTDGNYAIVGTSNSGFSSKQIVLYKINNQCGIIWKKDYGGPAADNGNGVQQCPDGGYIITGGTESYGKGKSDMWLIKTDASGVMTGSVTYGGTQDDEGIAVVANNDGSYVVAIRDSSTSADIDIRVIKYKSDLTLSPEWNKVFWGTEKDTPKRIRATNEGGYIVGANSRSFGDPDNVQMWWLKLDAGGNLQWERNFGWAQHEHCHDIKQEADGGFIAVGHSRSGPLPNQKLYFVKTNAIGDVSVPEFDLRNNFYVYPNPNKGLFNIDLSEIPANTAIRINNTMGQLIYSGPLEALNSDNTKFLDLSAEAPGMYLLTVIYGSDSQNAIITKKIIIEK